MVGAASGAHSQFLTEGQAGEYNALRGLNSPGQSIWLGFLDRWLLADGRLSSETFAGSLCRCYCCAAVA